MMESSFSRIVVAVTCIAPWPDLLKLFVSRSFVFVPFLIRFTQGVLEEILPNRFDFCMRGHSIEGKLPNPPEWIRHNA